MANGTRVVAPAAGKVEKGRVGRPPPTDDAHESRPLRVALVNIMPDTGFEDAHRRFSNLIVAGSRGLELDLRCYRLPSIFCADRHLARRASYQEVGLLYRDPPDALVVTGTEPISPELTSEGYWEALAELVRWATTRVPSTLMSCLAAHAALRVLDDVDRTPLPVKCSGVFPQPVDRSHVLGIGLNPIAAFPHSRWNEVRGSLLQSLGYDVVVGTEGGEWTVAARETAGHMLVLVQGHPEYDPTTLLREYRRDLRRFAGGSAACPRVPVGYLDAVGESRLCGWRTAIGRIPPPDWRRDFPLDAVVRHVVPSWAHNATQLFVNWITDARRRATTLAGARSGRA